jgi:hypothetical protein
MMLETAKGSHTFVDVEVVLEQTGENVRGRWRTIDAAEHRAAGEVTGTVARVTAQQRVDVTFTFVGHHVGSPPGGQQCQGAARASGQLTYNTSVDTDGRRVDESIDAHGWSIRLKAFDGFGFRSCSPIPYATWTLTRNSR